MLFVFKEIFNSNLLSLISRSYSLVNLLETCSISSFCLSFTISIIRAHGTEKRLRKTAKKLCQWNSVSLDCCRRLLMMVRHKNDFHKQNEKTWSLFLKQINQTQIKRHEQFPGKKINELLSVSKTNWYAENEISLEWELLVNDDELRKFSRVSCVSKRSSSRARRHSRIAPPNRCWNSKYFN